MQSKYIKNNFILFLTSYLLIVLVFSFLSYKFFISDFIELEKKQNNDNINTVLSLINTNIETIERLITDYSKWDDTYDFIINPNKEYIYENFREGTTTLIDLNLDFILFANMNKKTVYSKYPNKILEKNAEDFEKEIYYRFRKGQNENTVFKYKSHTLYLIKAEILKSDHSGEVRGYIYTGKIINNKNLNELTSVFKTMKMSNNNLAANNFKTKLSYVKNVKLDIDTKGSNIINHIQIFDDGKEHVFSIEAENSRDIVNNGKETIIIFNIIISIFLFIILYIIYKNQRILERYNELLSSKVTIKTNQLNRTLRKLRSKNKELYTLANVDSLTNIRNRRNYFVQSAKVLKKAIIYDTQLCVLLMDIDYFKKINDTYGHSAGDKVLKEFCTIINSIIDKDAIFGRIGGEEFCITFSNIDITEVNEIAEKIREKCEETIITVDDEKIKFTLSLGLSSRENFVNIDEILQVSDKLLYKAKEGGRNRLIRTSVH